MIGNETEIYVKENLVKISTEIDNIIDIDLANVTKVLGTNLPKEFQKITEVIKAISSKYNVIRRVKAKILSKLMIGISKVSSFLRSILTKKMAKLKESQLFINARSHLANPKQEMLLYTKNLYHY